MSNFENFDPSNMITVQSRMQTPNLSPKCEQSCNPYGIAAFVCEQSVAELCMNIYTTGDKSRAAFMTVEVACNGKIRKGFIKVCGLQVTTDTVFEQPDDWQPKA